MCTHESFERRATQVLSALTAAAASAAMSARPEAAACSSGSSAARSTAAAAGSARIAVHAARVPRGRRHRLAPAAPHHIMRSHDAVAAWALRLS